MKCFRFLQYPDTEDSYHPSPVSLHLKSPVCMRSRACSSSVKGAVSCLLRSRHSFQKVHHRPWSSFSLVLILGSSQWRPPVHGCLYASHLPTPFKRTAGILLRHSLSPPLDKTRSLRLSIKKTSAADRDFSMPHVHLWMSFHFFYTLKRKCSTSPSCTS